MTKHEFATVQRQLAKQLLSTLGVMPEVAEELSKKNTKFYSDRPDRLFDGIICRLDDKPEWKAQVEKLEKEYHIYVYYACHYYAEYGEILDCLYIPSKRSFDEEEETERWMLQEAREGIVPIYAINFDVPDYSEFGYGTYRERWGGLSKIY